MRSKAHAAPAAHHAFRVLSCGWIANRRKPTGKNRNRAKPTQNGFMGCLVSEPLSAALVVGFASAERPDGAVMVVARAGGEAGVWASRRPAVPLRLSVAEAADCAAGRVGELPGATVEAAVCPEGANSACMVPAAAQANMPSFQIKSCGDKPPLAASRLRSPSDTGPDLIPARL